MESQRDLFGFKRLPQRGRLLVGRLVVSHEIILSVFFRQVECRQKYLPTYPPAWLPFSCADVPCAGLWVCLLGHA